MNGHVQLPGIKAARCLIEDRQAFLARLQRISREFSTHIVCFNIDMLAGRRHAELAVRLARRSWEERDTIANTFEMEALLYATGSRQCNAAMKFGIHEGDNLLYICCEPEVNDIIWTALSDLFDYADPDTFETVDEKKKERLIDLFGITSLELEAVDTGTTITDLVLERVALLQVVR
jgi:KEOPS complex subunit Cgi121